jgi:hypothetical protein
MQGCNLRLNAGERDGTTGSMASMVACRRLVVLAEAVTLVPSTPPSIKCYQTVSLANGGGDFQIEIWLFCVSL